MTSPLPPPAACPTSTTSPDAAELEARPRPAGLDAIHTDPAVPLLVAPCSRSAARYSVLTWHYSRKMPANGKLACFGVWEHGRFVGVIIYGRGATQHLGSPYGLTQAECVELVRVALRDHQQPVTAMIAASLRQLRAACPGLQLVVSYADTGQGHHGGIYQAGNWIYTGTTSPHSPYYVMYGKMIHGRTLRHRALHRPSGETALNFVQRTMDATAHQVKGASIKHRYVYPLNKVIRRRVSGLAKPYPARPVS